MARVYYNKLVRDGIPELIRNSGADFSVRTAADTGEFQQELLKKIREEADALSRARDRETFLDEYADLMTVLDALATELGFSESDIRVALEENVSRKGGFSERLFLEWSADEEYVSNESVQGMQ